ncbi:MAG TPA: esterase-like activity of phytase family protein, partial [Vicinamibacterales bacterium]|nr:esterase-like activity of phytase family protein [Vicinamibacterales bacterium]
MGVWAISARAIPSLQAPVQRIAIDATPVPLHPDDPSLTTIGDFRFAGGLELKTRQSTLLHELSDIAMTGADRFVAVGDGGVLLSARVVLDSKGRLTGVADASLSRLAGMDGRPLTDTNADAEGLTVLPSGDRLISFERHPRIWLYPRNGVLPREAPRPNAEFEDNAGIEAIAAAPDLGADAYLVGEEATGATWTCRLSTTCVKGHVVEKPDEFGLVSMTRLPDGLTAYLLRAYDPVRRSRIGLRIFRGTTLIARLDLAVPMTVDNFEGLTSTDAGE